MIVCIGDLMVDVFTDGDGAQRRHPGGKAAIYALTARALGAPAAVVGCLGADEDGAAVSGALRASGTDVSGVVVRKEETTGADFFEGGDWRMERGANWALTAQDVREALTGLSVRATDGVSAVIVNQGIALEASQEAVSYAQEQGLFLVLHLGPEAIEERRKVDPRFYPLADVIVVSQREAGVLAEHLGLDAGRTGADLARMLFDATGPQWALLLSFGVGGAHLVARDGDRVVTAEIPPSSGPDHEVEKYIGANDTAVAAWVTHLVHGEPGAPARRETPSFREATDALTHSVGLAALTLQDRGPLTAAIGTPEVFVRLDVQRA
ncbi:carbohydrate kinase family protein [Streptomyces canus]|uniref:carbohydrate kinase family protein n=1 Tax=Streptomyces canus TaxID=58343 RepID=UPI002E2A9088|nr:carbohydrate kinase family protein [Streptomyces canus]